MRILYTVLLIVSVFIARFFAIFLLPAVLYLFKVELDLSLKEMKVIWYSGLVRGLFTTILREFTYIGAISFGLGWLVTSPREGLIRSATLGVVIFTIFVLTNLLEVFARKIGLDQTIYNEM